MDSWVTFENKKYFSNARINEILKEFSVFGINTKLPYKKNKNFYFCRSVTFFIFHFKRPITYFYVIFLSMNNAHTK